MAAGIDVLGPYGPAEFKETNLTTLSATMTTDVASLGTIVSCEPVSVLGNVFLIVYTSN